jgi:LPLT family lysophospholipid transporter-like MFS transporter
MARDWSSDVCSSDLFAGVLTTYALASFANLFIPALPAENAGESFHPWRLLKKFWAALALMFKNPDARFSLLGSSVFWGSGSTLRLVLFAWVPAALLINDNQTPSNLMGALSIGIVLGAVAAGAWVSLANVNRALLGGVLLGPVILGLAAVHSLTLAAFLMVAVGFCGGLFVVPLNALLQKCGHESIGAGNALAVQNFSENIAMLLFVGAYGWAMAVGVPIMLSIAGFGLLLLVFMAVLAVFRLRRG